MARQRRPSRLHEPPQQPVAGVFEINEDGKTSSWRDYFDMKEVEAQVAGGARPRTSGHRAVTLDRARDQTHYEQPTSTDTRSFRRPRSPARPPWVKTDARALAHPIVATTRSSTPRRGRVDNTIPGDRGSPRPQCAVLAAPVRSWPRLPLIRAIPVPKARSATFRDAGLAIPMAGY